MAAETDNEKNEKKGGKKGGRIALIVCLVAIIILLGVIIYLLLRKQAPAPQQSADTGPERETLVTKENAERVAEDFFQDTPENVPQAYTVTMSSDWTFEDGSKPSEDAYVENSNFNTTGVYFDIIKEDTEETLYESPIIPVGKHISNIKLDKDLDAGKYDCVCVYHLVDDDGKTLTTVRVAVKITVLN